jgi:FAD-linked sulfhydryl oxidase
MLGIPRSARLFLIIVGVVILPSIYLLYPHHDIPQAPGSYVTEYEAGGIDSEHWRTPVKPDFEKEEARWSQAEAVEEDAAERKNGNLAPYVPSDKTWLNHGMTGVGGKAGAIAENVLSGGVIMPKLANATAK